MNKQKYYRTYRPYGKFDRECRILLISDSMLRKSDQMRVGESISVQLADNSIVRIIAGFVTDLFSVPPWLHTLFKPYDNKLNLAAIVHDYLYEEWERFLAENPQLVVSDPRKYADDAMLDIMNRYRPGSRTSLVYYYAVRWFGGKNWRKFRARNLGENG